MRQDHPGPGPDRQGTREEALLIARLQAATPLLLHVLMLLRDHLPWRRLSPYAKKTIETALTYALDEPHGEEVAP